MKLSSDFVFAKGWAICQALLLDLSVRRGLVGMTGLFLSTELRAPLRSTALFTFCHFDRSIVFSLALAQNRGFCAKEERQRSEVASRVYAACLERSLARRVEKSRSASDGQKGVDRAIQSDFSTALEMTMAGRLKAPRPCRRRAVDLFFAEKYAPSGKYAVCFAAYFDIHRHI